MDNSFAASFPQHCNLADLELSRAGRSFVENREKPSPINTTRLKAFRQVTRAAILSILETGQVTMEFLKRQREVERVDELFMVSADGQEIYVEQWNADSVALSEQTFQTFSFDTLPEKYWKKYAHACKFVDLVKSKTSKVTIYSDRAKGVLMENNPPNFEATFFQGPKIMMSGRQIRIKEDSGACLTLDCDWVTSAVNAYTKDLLLHAAQLREQCLRMEASVNTVQAMGAAIEESLFPVTVGRRPSTSFCSSSSSSSNSDLWPSPQFGQQLHHSPTHWSDESFMSLPSPPVPRLDLRWRETPQKVVQTNDQPSSALDNTCGTPSSPVRHLSTLKGRRQRSQMTASSASSSCPQYDSHHSSSIMVPHSNQNGTFRVRESSPEQTVSCGHVLANVFTVFGADVKPDQHFYSETFGCAKIQGTGHAQNCSVAASSVVPSSAPLVTVTNDAIACDTFCPVNRMNVASSNTQFLPRGVDNTLASSRKDAVLDSSLPDSHSPNPTATTVSAATQSQTEVFDVHASTVIRKTFVPYTGWVLLLENGTIWVCYNEGTQLGMKYNQPTDLVYVDQGGIKHRYFQSDVVPEVVRQKMERLPRIIEKTKKAVAKPNP